MEIELINWFTAEYLFNPRNRMFLPYLISCLVIIALYIWFNKKTAGAYFNRGIWWSDSARLDYKYFIVVTVIKTMFILPLLFTASEVSKEIFFTLENYLGYQNPLSISHTALAFLYTVSLFVVGDLTRYCLHRLMHSIPWLWSIHKVHHSACVLTPITFYRVHPLENLLFGLRYAASTGVVTGVFIYMFGFGLQPFEIIGVNVFVFIAHVAGDNLRHSHVAFGYPDWLERIFISPAQHQIHHTQQGSRKNFGGVLAIWDRLFGSLRTSRAGDEYIFGIEQAENHKSVLGLIFTPMLEITGSGIKFILTTFSLLKPEKRNA